MDAKTLGIALMVLVSWGVGSFFGKLAAIRLGEKSAFWDLVGYAPALIIYCLFAFKLKDLVESDKIGIIWGVLAGAIGSLGLVGFYILLTKKDASTAVPLTAIFPALTAILAFIFLKEQLTLAKGMGIILSAIALFLLSL